MGIRMCVARCCCAVVGCLTCNVLGTIYTAALALVDYGCTPFADETDWTDRVFQNNSDDLIDNATVVCNSIGKANSNVAGNYWEAFSSSNGNTGVVSSTCRPNYNVTEAEYPNEWDVCANNTVEALFELGIIADQPNMPISGSYDAFPEVGWTVTLSQGDGLSNEVTQVTLTITMDRNANTYSSKITVTELTRDDDQAGGSTSSVVATDYALASTASSLSGSVKFKVTPITPTYTDATYGLVDKWKLEYAVVIGGVSVTIPDFEFTQLVRDGAGNGLGLNPFLFQQGTRYSSTYWKNHFKARYTDVSAVLSHTAPYTGDSVEICCNTAGVGYSANQIAVPTDLSVDSNYTAWPYLSTSSTIKPWTPSIAPASPGPNNPPVGLYWYPANSTYGAIDFDSAANSFSMYSRIANYAVSGNSTMNLAHSTDGVNTDEGLWNPCDTNTLRLSFSDDFNVTVPSGGWPAGMTETELTPNLDLRVGYEGSSTVAQVFMSVTYDVALGTYARTFSVGGGSGNTIYSAGTDPSQDIVIDIIFTPAGTYVSGATTYNKWYRNFNITYGGSSISIPTLPVLIALNTPFAIAWQQFRYDAKDAGQSSYTVSDLSIDMLDT